MCVCVCLGVGVQNRDRSEYSPLSSYSFRVIHIPYVCMYVRINVCVCVRVRVCVRVVCARV